MIVLAELLLGHEDRNEKAELISGELLSCRKLEIHALSLVLNEKKLLFLIA